MQTGNTQSPAVAGPMPFRGPERRSPQTVYESWINSSRQVLPHLLFNRPFDFDQRDCLGSKHNGEFHFISHAEFKRQCLLFAAALRAGGFVPGDRLVIVAENQPGWIICDMGTLLCGGVVVPIFPTLDAEQSRYIIEHCEAHWIVVSNQQQLDKIASLQEQLTIRQAICLEEGLDSSHCHFPLLSLQQFLLQGGEQLEQFRQPIMEDLERQQPDDLCSIIYTSGTTGRPKGVMLSHRNFVFSALAGIHIQYVRELQRNNPPRELAVLPLSHVFARMIYYSLIVISGGSMAFTEGIGTVAADMQKIRPTVMAGVPRLYETIYHKILTQLRRSPPLKRKLAFWALEVGKRYFLAPRPGLLLSCQNAIARTLVFRKIHAQFGGELKAMLSSGAKLRSDVALFYCGIGLPLTEGYGLTETSPTITCLRPADIHPGSVGPAVRGVEVRIDDEGEILARGPNVMLGYYKDELATREVLDDEGWFRTGDLGTRDEQGRVSITGRKKEVIVLSNGENVAPAPIEALLTASDYIEQVVLYGDEQPFVAALIYPDQEHSRAYLQQQGLKPERKADLSQEPALEALIRQEIERLTRGRIASFAKIRQFRLLARELSAEYGEITPTLKIKRHVVKENFADQLQSMFRK